MEPSQTPAVYKAMAAVMADMSKVGVGKDQFNKQQGFKYRGVDDVMNTLAPSLSKHGLLIVPRVIERTVSERESKSGGTLFHTVLKVDFDFIAASDGSKYTTSLIGEGMDSGDKATNKAMAIAYKYACFQAFCIPLEGSDPDAESHEVAKSNGHDKITEQQQEQLKSLISEVKADEGKFLAYLKLRTLGEMRASDFSRAVDALNKKRQQ